MTPKMPLSGSKHSSEHVARVLVENVADRDTLKKGEFESIAWAELYQTMEEALLRRM